MVEVCLLDRATGGIDEFAIEIVGVEVGVGPPDEGEVAVLWYVDDSVRRYFSTASFFFSRSLTNAHDRPRLTFVSQDGLSLILQRRGACRRLVGWHYSSYQSSNYSPCSGYKYLKVRGRGTEQPWGDTLRLGKMLVEPPPTILPGSPDGGAKGLQ